MTRGKTILVVDDEPHIRAFLAMVLEDEGYRVETATNGCEALRKAHDRPPDVILLDLLMPVLDGAGFLRECRADPAFRTVLVLLMSAADAHVRAEAGGAHAVLAKPFDLDRLMEAVDGHCGHQVGLAAGPVDDPPDHPAHLAEGAVGRLRPVGDRGGLDGRHLARGA